MITHRLLGELTLLVFLLLGGSCRSILNVTETDRHPPRTDADVTEAPPTDGVVEAEDFLRGDVNSDGEVSLSDSHALLLFLFHGHPTVPLPDCADARDTNADGNVNLVDAVVTLNHLFGEGQPLAAPFPEAGPADPVLGCAEYGVGSSLDDPRARLVVLSAEAAGGDDGRATIVIGASHSTAIAGHFFKLHLPPGVFAGSQARGIDLTKKLDRGSEFLHGRMEGDTFTHGLLVSLAGRATTIPATGDVVPIFQLEVCLHEGTVAGDYPIALTAGEFVDAESGRSIKPALVSGTLTVAADVTVTGDCKES